MSYDKFIWQEGDIEFADEAKFKENADIYDAISERKYASCGICQDCMECSDEDKIIADLVIDKIYSSYFVDKNTDRAIAKKVSGSIVRLSRMLLSEKITLTKQLYCCIKTGLIDRLVKNNILTIEECKDIK